jgi:ABC-type transport system involved in cytochrome c biogenesis permease subunit
MATSEIMRPAVVAPKTGTPIEPVSFRAAIVRVLDVLASLKLTVVLFALSIFLVFAGTLAQVDHGVWDVVNHMYFRVWIAKVDFLAFERLVRMFYPVQWNLTGGFHFPGGKLLGGLLLANLLAAHSVRFKINASGRRLWSGVAVISLGLIVTVLVVRTGMKDTLASELSPAFCSVLWESLRASLAAVALAGAYFLVLHRGRGRAAEWWLFLTIDVALGIAAIWLFTHSDARLDDSGLRILWQLAKGLAAGVVLLVGCVLVFRKRAGVVLLHGGVALMMCSELLTGLTANEGQMTIDEGATANYSQDIRSTELAVIDHSASDQDRVTVVPESLLVKNVGNAGRIEHADLPFTIRVHRWLANSTLRDLVAKESSPATEGLGTHFAVDELRLETGIESDSAPDAPSAYIELFSKTDGHSLGTYLVSASLKEQPIQVDGHAYDLGLRFKRTYYPFSLMLEKFRFDRYTGTSTAKNYSSQVQLKDPVNNVDRELLIWMNNPLRYAGNTFYQQSFDKDTEKTTVLQVVENPGWMMPYVGCMLVLTGMLAHFGTTLARFLRRRADAAALASELPIAGRQSVQSRRADKPVLADNSSAFAKFTRWFPAILVAVFACYLAGHMEMPKSAPSEMQVYEFTKLPLSYQGRIKPYDTLARNALQILSGRQEVIGKDKTGAMAKLMGAKEKSPAIVWLLDVISGAPAAADARVFRIENVDLLQTLGLEPREGMRYALSEFRDKLGILEKQVELARQQPESEQSLYQKAVLTFGTKLHLIAMLIQSFRPPELSTDRAQLAESLQKVQETIAELRASEVPHAAPPRDAEGRWMPLMEAEMELLRDRVTNQPTNPATTALASMLDAYSRGDATTFNKELFDYRDVLVDYERALAAHAGELKAAGVASSEILSQPKINFEVFYNQFSPIYYAAVLYVVAFVLGALSWLGWTEPLRRAATWLLCFTLVVHTLALVGRIYISGRPPVTNLYSAAVFIGWAGVVLALVFESLYSLGLGNIVASVIGFLTLVIAHFLSLDGDTFTVLLAVLDTQFWLATHVVCIAMGNSTTFVAGFFGIVYILLGQVIPILGPEQRRELTRMIYGTLCFAIFFSFVGTVLGGLWADNSWGRFWGWDPKENGALLIVLFNALVLHARWGGMVAGRGLAMFAVGGNIVTAWSLFGTNAMGVGLHSYGFDRGVTTWLLAFVASQAAIIVIGSLPQNWWRFGSAANAA